MTDTLPPMTDEERRVFDEYFAGRDDLAGDPLIRTFVNMPLDNRPLRKEEIEGLELFRERENA